MSAAQFIDTSRLRFHVRTHGEEGSPPMVLIHGEFASSRWWEPFFQILPTAIRAYAPDLRGTGLSDRSEAGYSVEEQCADLKLLIDALELNDFDLVAHSFGAAIAVEYALQQQHRINSLTLLAPPPLEGIRTPVDTMLILDQMRENRDLLARSLMLLMPSYCSRVMETLLNVEMEPHYDYAKNIYFIKLLQDAVDMAPSLFTGPAEALNNWNRFDEARSLSLPTLIIWGDQDQIVSEEMVTRTLLAIPGAENLQILRGIGHSPMIEAPLLLAERIVDFITGDHEQYSQIRQSVEE